MNVNGCVYVCEFAAPQMHEHRVEGPAHPFSFYFKWASSLPRGKLAVLHSGLDPVRSSGDTRGRASLQLVEFLDGLIESRCS